MPPATTRPARTVHRALAAGAVVLAAAFVAACGGSTAATTSTTAATATPAVRPPAVALQGCNYVVDGIVPAGMSQGVQPPFPSFGPNRAALSALAHIRQHGGTGLIDGFTIPPGTALYAGPDPTVAPVATVPGARSLLIAEPVLWTSSSGAHWLATFLACGGPNLYWIDVHQISRADSAAGTQVTASIAAALATPLTGSGASTAPLTITADHRFAWTTGKVTFAVARGEFQGF
jgi:hypothetical protein